MRPLCALVSALALLGIAAPAAAEPVTASGDDAALAVAPDGSPRVVVTRGNGVAVYARGAAWTQAVALATPGPAAVVGAAATRSRTYALLEDPSGGWLALANLGARARLTVLARAAPGTQLGLGGFAVDRRGSPVAAWTVLDQEGHSALRLFRRGKTIQITRGGVPGSDVPPPAAPVVLRNGSVRVLESYGIPRASATIEWRREGREWVGQYVFASALGLPVGLLRAAATGTTVFSAWDEDYGNGDVEVVVARHAGGRESSQLVLAHATLVELVAAGSGYEVAANDWIPAEAFGTAADEVLSAGVVAAGATRSELDGILLGYAARGRAREYLLDRDGRLDWFRAATTRTTTVVAAARRTGAGVDVSGRVEGASTGSVAVYRERPGEARVLVATATLAADGSFHAADTPTAFPVTYRAVYVDPASGLPYASLVRDVVD